MAEKILQTRIINKHTSYDIATSNEQFIPKLGEIVLAKLDVQKNDGQVVPTFLMKVGDGTSNLKALNWLSAPASDVYSWAKAANKPSYIASEIARGSSTVATDLGKAEEAILALQAAVGENGAVASAIKAAIEALDVADTAVEKQFVTAVAEADGKISVTRRALTADDIPELTIAKITGLQDALDAKAVKATVDEKFTAIDIAIGTTLPGQIADAKAAGTDAQTYAEGIYKVNGETKTGVLAQYMTSNDAEVAAVRGIAEAARTEEEVNTQIDAKLNPVIERVDGNATAIANEKSRAEGVESGLNTRLTTVEGKVDALSSATHFLGVKDALPAESANGDIVIVGNKEYVYDAASTADVKWVELGDTTAELNAINGLNQRITAVETDLSETGDTTLAIKAAKDAADAAQAHSEQVAKNLTAEAERAANAEATILGVVGDASTANTVFGAKKYAEEKAAAAESAAKSDTKQKVEALEATVAQNKTDAAAATKKVADDFAAYEEANDAALDVVRQNAQKGVDDAADALTYAKSVETNKVDKNTEAIDAIESDISTNVVKVNDSGDGKYNLVVGSDTIIFDCGGAE